MPAHFILTFDCEGKWGVADHLAARHRRELSEARLSAAYQSIVAVLDEYSIPATFAFVGAFTQSPRDFARARPAIEAIGRNAPNYIGPALRDLDETGGSGWHGHHLVDLVKEARAGHEIALHGVTHVPWTDLDGASVRSELSLLQQLEGPIRLSKTFVYPRNRIAHADELAKFGFAGFREARSRSRFRSLLSEFNLFEVPDRRRPPDGIVHIPAGFFLNWRGGARLLVPPVVTQIRAERLLKTAAANDGVVHYWLHPENVASAPSTLALLKMLARKVAAAREAGDCEVTTQLGYCR